MDFAVDRHYTEMSLDPRQGLIISCHVEVGILNFRRRRLDLNATL